MAHLPLEPYWQFFVPAWSAEGRGVAQPQLHFELGTICCSRPPERYLSDELQLDDAGVMPTCFLPGVAEEELSPPCSVRVPAGLGVERPFTKWYLGGVDRDPALRMRLLRAICGPGGHRPV